MIGAQLRNGAVWIWTVSSIKSNVDKCCQRLVTRAVWPQFFIMELPCSSHWIFSIFNPAFHSWPSTSEKCISVGSVIVLLASILGIINTSLVLSYCIYSPFNRLLLPSASIYLKYTYRFLCQPIYASWKLEPLLLSKEYIYSLF